MKNANTKPYDYFAAMEQLRDKDNPPSAERLQRLKDAVAINASDPEAVALYVDISDDRWADIYPPVETNTTPSTEKAIDTFLDTYGRPSQKEEELLERLIFNPVPEYGTVLAQQSDNALSDDSPAQLAQQINSLAAQADKRASESSKTKPAKQPEPQPSGSLSLELAKIFVKQGHFERAHDIISKIILNNPEKNVYFADQMRFLEKLITIKNAQTNKKQKKDK